MANGDLERRDRAIFRKRLALVVETLGGKRAASGLAGVSEPHLYRYLKGSSVPTLRPLMGICRAAGVSLDWLAGLGDDGGPEGAPQPPAPSGAALFYNAAYPQIREAVEVAFMLCGYKPTEGLVSLLAVHTYAAAAFALRDMGAQALAEEQAQLSSCTVHQ